MAASSTVAETGAITRFAGRFFQEGFRPRYEVQELLHQCFVVGYQSLPLVGITKDLREITHKLNSSDAFWSLLNDQQLASEMHRSLRNTAAATALLQASAADMQQLTRGLRQGRGPAGYLLTDTDFAGRMRHATRQLAGTSDTLARTLADLKRQIQTPNGPLNTLLADTAMARNLRQSLRNVELGTAGFSQNMDALKHSFLLRGYFRKQAKKDKARTATP